MNDFETRFGGIARLYGRTGLERLRSAHVCVVGIGGIGSWAAEALARSGIGKLTLVDLDEICVTNLNRQLHAVEGMVGRSKVEVMAERVRAINPECDVRPVIKFFTEATADSILSPGFNALVDAIDSVMSKARLIAQCRVRGIPLVVCGGAGGRRDATAVRVADMSRVSHDRLIAQVRKDLRKHYGFPANGKTIGIECVFSPEPQVFPQQDGSVCAIPAPGADGESLRLNCDSGFGTATFVTGAFGFAAAGAVVSRIAAGD